MFLFGKPASVVCRSTCSIRIWRSINPGIAPSQTGCIPTIPNSGCDKKLFSASAACACSKRSEYTPAAVHINEGHPGLSLLERVRTLVEEGKKFQEAVAQVRESSIFTTHTPLSAGTDIFPFPLFEKYFSQAYAQFGTDRDGLLQLGVYPPDPGAGFNMTVFALRMTKFCNAVSKKHAEVARQIWTSVWPGKERGRSPDRLDYEWRSSAHVDGSLWAATSDGQVCGPGLDSASGPSPASGNWSDSIPDAELWRVRRRLKNELIVEINERARDRWQKKSIRAESVIAFGALLDPESFTIGFARRFTAYKRPDLILHDLERLKRILTNPLRARCRSFLPEKPILPI